MEWTKEYPREKGFYWIRGEFPYIADTTEVVVEVAQGWCQDKDLSFFYAGSGFPQHKSDAKGYEWYGPMKPP